MQGDTTAVGQGELVVSSGQPAPLFDLAEAAFDDVPIRPRWTRAPMVKRCVRRTPAPHTLSRGTHRGLDIKPVGRFGSSPLSAGRDIWMSVDGLACCTALRPNGWRIYPAAALLGAVEPDEAGVAAVIAVALMLVPVRCPDTFTLVPTG